jgi:predicted Zn finger-like uncharacterized protein
VLITTCTHCRARFRVTPMQLNAKQGQVRCGRCGEVFSGFESLERHPDDDITTRLAAARQAAASAPESPPVADAIETLEELPVPEPEPRPAEEVEATPQPAPAPPRPRSRPDLVLPPPPRKEPPARAWWFGAALLALLLAGQAAYGYRSTLAQRYPVLRPVLESVCQRAGCAVPWMRDESLLKLEDSELLEVPGKPNEIALGARVRNLAPAAQEFPYIELTLTDLSGQTAVRRVLRPADYLGRAVGAGEVLAAGAEVAIQLRLETPRLKATGYELLLFYP